MSFDCTVLGERDDFLKYREDLCDLGVGFIEIHLIIIIISILLLFELLPSMYMCDVYMYINVYTIIYCTGVHPANSTYRICGVSFIDIE